LSKALEDCDVVHYSGAGRELLGFVALRTARRMRVPLVVTPHTHEGMWGDSELDLDLYREASRVVAATEDEAARLARAGVPRRAIRVVGHGVSVTGAGDATRFRTRHGLGDAPMVLFMGRKTPDKGLDLVLQAAHELWERVPQARIVVAGTPGSERVLPPSITDPRVVDLGHLDDQSREDAFAACDVFCLPSAAEAFGLVILEAWFYGKPVVVSDIPTLRERVGEGGGLVVGREPAEAAAALSRLLTEDALRAHHGAFGRDIARSSTWQQTARTMTEMYQDAGARMGGSSSARKRVRG
jgi:glycosyltransferase involved in cell wall biosynthesis